MPRKMSLLSLLITAVLLTLSLSTVLYVRIYAGDAEPSFKLYYFYNNPCEACDEETKFYKKFNTAAGAEKDGVNLQVLVYNVFHNGSNIRFQELCDQYGVPKNKRYTPIVFIGDTYLTGNDEIDKRLRIEFLKAKAAFLKANPDAGGSGDSSGNNATNGPGMKAGAGSIGAAGQAIPLMAVDGLKAATGTGTTLVYFYVSSCNDCSKVKKMLTGLKTVYGIDKDGKTFSSTVTVLRYNVGEPTGLELVKKYFEAYHVPDKDQKVPLIFVGETYRAGGETTLSDLEAIIRSGRGLGTMLPEPGGWKPDAGTSGIKGYSLAGVFLIGFINGFNPCSLSMMLFLLSLLMVRSVNVLKFGLAFIAGKFLAYLALGTLAYNLLLMIDDSLLHGFQSLVKAVLLVIVVILAAANIQDCFAARDEKYDRIRMQLPKVLRRINHSWIKRITSIENMRLLLVVCFLLGIGISIGEFLCTGQIYLATILYVMKSSQGLNLQALSSFFVYVLAMIIPLLLLTGAIFKGKEIFDLSEAIRVKMHVIKLVNAVIFLILGIIIFLLF